MTKPKQSVQSLGASIRSSFLNHDDVNMMTISICSLNPQITTLWGREFEAAKMVDMAELWAEDLTTAPMPGLDTSRTRSARQRSTRRSSPSWRRGNADRQARIARDRSAARS
jgi:hypothetical protein